VLQPLVGDDSVLWKNLATSSEQQACGGEFRYFAVHATVEVVLQPGDTQKVDLKSCQKAWIGTAASGSAGLYTTNLSFVIVPISGPSAPEESAPRAG
jgi:hypothetical protein